MARRTLSQTERENKKKFDEELKHYSLDCLKQVYKIATTCMNMDTRLKASIWILERTYGKNYQVYKEEQEQQSNDMNINLVVIPPKQKQIDATEAEKQIRETINDETFANDTGNEEWEESWGDGDTYTSNK